MRRIKVLIVDDSAVVHQVLTATLSADTGIIMTGMGDDGARGLKEMHEAGPRTFAQDEDNCEVYGMPKEAVRPGTVERILPLSAIPGAITGGAALLAT